MIDAVAKEHAYYENNKKEINLQQNIEKNAAKEEKNEDELMKAVS